MQLPSNLILTRVRPSIYLGTCMAVWGVVSASQAAVKSFGGLLACRIMLGVTEAPFFPGAIMLMSSWVCSQIYELILLITDYTISVYAKRAGS